MNNGATSFETPPQFDIQPQRIVSLVPSITETMFDLNLGNRLIAITDYCIHPADQVSRLPRIGGVKNPDIAQIIALQPDLVMMNHDENRLEDALEVQDAGIRVWSTVSHTVADAINAMWDIMRVFDEPSMSDRVRWIERQMDWSSAAAQQIEPVRVFAPVWYDPWMTIGPDTLIHDLLRVCGGKNIFAEHPNANEKSYFTITLEDIIAAQPDVIILPDEPFVFDESHKKELATLAIPAAANNRIHIIDGTLLTWFGTRLALGMNAIAQILMPGEE